MSETRYLQYGEFSWLQTQYRKKSKADDEQRDSREVEATKDEQAVPPTHCQTSVSMSRTSVDNNGNSQNERSCSAHAHYSRDFSVDAAFSALAEVGYSDLHRPDPSLQCAGIPRNTIDDVNIVVGEAVILEG